VSDSPPDSWYDPPEPDFEIEIKWEREIKDQTVECDKCKEVATMEGAIGDVRYAGTYFAYCKDHYDTIEEDTIREIETYEPDFDDEGD
jgi:hypothetical protein